MLLIDPCAILALAASASDPCPATLACAAATLVVVPQDYEERSLWPTRLAPSAPISFIYLPLVTLYLVSRLYMLLTPLSSVLLSFTTRFGCYLTLIFMVLTF